MALCRATSRKVNSLRLWHQPLFRQRAAVTTRQSRTVFSFSGLMLHSNIASLIMCMSGCRITLRSVRSLVLACSIRWLGRRRRRGGGRDRVLRHSAHPCQKPSGVLGGQRTKPGHAVRRIEVPGILGEADEVADRRIGGPGATKGRPDEVRRHPRGEKGPNVGSGADRLDRRQVPADTRRFCCGGRKGRIRRRLGCRRAPGRFGRRWLAQCRTRLPLPARPPLEKALVIAHRSCPAAGRGARTPPDQPGRGGAW